MDGGDESKNITTLTAREHFLCHWLLVEMYPENNGLRYAFWCMCNMSNKDQNRYIPSSRIYEYGRKLYSEMMIGNVYRLGIKHSDERKREIGEWRRGMKHSDETKKKIGNAHRGKIVSEETRLKISKAASGKNHRMYGKRHSEQTKSRMSKNSVNVRSIVQIDRGGIFIKEHICISRIAFTDPSAVVKCCRGKVKTHKGFKWMYSEDYYTNVGGE